MNNAEKFREVFGIYATELWAMSENEFLKWLNSVLLQPDDEELFLSDHAKTWQAYRKEQK